MIKIIKSDHCLVVAFLLMNKKINYGTKIKNKRYSLKKLLINILIKNFVI